MSGMIKKSVCFIAAGVACGYLLLSLSFLIPFRWPEKLREETVSTLYREKLYPTDRLSGRTIDNWADSFSLMIGSYEGDETAFEKASNAYYYSSHHNVYVTLSGRGNPEFPLKKFSYARYWHGYLVLLRPLMSVFSFSQIRLLNTFCVWGLTGAALLVLMRNVPESVCPFILTLLLLAPSAIGKCMEYSGVFYIALTMALLIALGRKGGFEGGRVRYLFLAGGMLTAYVDFLSAPTLSLSIPFVILCLRRKGEKELPALALSCLLFWAAGYAGMWSGKWLIALLFQRRVFLDSLLQAVRERAALLGRNRRLLYRLGAVGRNAGQLFRDYRLDCLILAYICVMVLRNHSDYRHMTGADVRLKALLLVPLVISLCWYLILANHSVVHARLHAYRTGAPAVFGLLCALNGRKQKAGKTGQKPEQVPGQKPGQVPGQMPGQ